MENIQLGVPNDSITLIAHEKEIVHMSSFADREPVNDMAAGNRTSDQNNNEMSNETNFSYSDPENDLEPKMDKSKTTISASDISAYQIKNPDKTKTYPVQIFTAQDSSKPSKSSNNAIAPTTEYNTNIVPNTLLRRWRVWPGNNRFYCSGRIVMPKNNRVTIITFLLITVPTIIFWSFDCRLTFHKLKFGLVPIVLSVVLYVAVMAFMALSALTDPGIIPRSSNSEKEEIETICKKEIFHSTGNITGFNSVLGPIEPRVHPDPENSTKIKYCSTCKMYRPPGTHHCRICNNCILQFDHHCPFIGNCVGLRNYRYFFGFITTLTFYCIFTLACTISHFVLLQQEINDFKVTLSKTWPSVITVVTCGIMVWPMCGLASFHVNILGAGFTTYEYESGKANCTCGKLMRNFWGMVGMDIGESLVDGRRHVSSANPLENKPEYPDGVRRFTSVKVFEITEPGKKRQEVTKKN